MADGTIPEPSVKTLEAVGRWMDRNGESIYGTSACILPEAPWGRCTIKGQKIYLHVFAWPGDAVLHVSGLTNNATAAYLLSDPSHKLALNREHDAIGITLPAIAPDGTDTVVVMEVAGTPQSDAPLITQGSDAPFELDYLHAKTAGKAVKRFNREGQFHISKWTGPGDSITWRLLVSQAGAYRVTIRYSARSEWAGRNFLVAIGTENLNGVVNATGEGYAYRSFDVGSVKLAKAGEYTVTIRPAAASDQYLMYFQSLELEPVW
jgi:alpha-L-fucosidase